ncbi:TfoX/Sxy family protein [Maribellus maritimus]|uniref:TfoX/Sxy family protein n=1 Tax=Maribellus maritimus TaxID=2870838 RepID=UPI001EEB7AFE|nr:TfoX/Sxy family protein [Maribellus maritimus]MCG6185867.1 TfoX/Sxy family protein [Maribellus maritimus]
MEKLSDLPNISKVLENELEQVGITSAEELREVGTESAFVRILTNDETACFSKLCALEGAIQGIRWHNLSSNRKEELRGFFRMKKLK